MPPEFRVIIDDFAGFIYEMIWEALHPVNSEVMPDTTNLDTLVQFMCDNQLGAEEGGERATAMGFAGVMPGFTLNVETDTAYRAIEEGIFEALNAFIVPVLNGALKNTISSAVTSNQNDGGELHTIINVDYNITSYNFDRTKGLVEQLNDVFKDVVDKMLLPASNFIWNATGEGDPLAVLEDNLVRLLKLIIQKGGEPEDVSGYNLKQLGDYIARVAVEQFVKHLDFEKGDSMEKIAYEGVRELVIRLVPEVNYADLPANTTSTQYRDAIIEMAADLACYYLNANIGLDCSLTTSAEQFISDFVTWCMPYINGLFDPTDYNDAKTNGTGWDEIDAILWQFIPKDWMNYEEMFETVKGAGNGTAESLTFKSLVEYFVDAVFAMDIGKLYTFFAHVDDSPLAQPARTVIIDFVSDILNTAFYTTDANGVKQDIVPALATFDAVINPVTNATGIIAGLLKSLATRTELQTTTVNLVTMLMGLAEPQSLGDVDIDIDGRINCTSGSLSTTMRISNRSEGVNSGWLPVGATEIDQDKMYEIELVELTNNAGLTASVTSGQKIAANAYIDVPVTGTVSEATEARFDLKYYILDENGARINDGTPRVESVYTHLYTTTSNYDASSAEATANNVTFEAFPTYLYTTDVYNAALFSILATNEKGLVTSAVDITRAIIAGTLPEGITANAPESGVIVSIDDSSATVDSYGTVNPYVSNIDPDAAQPYGIYELTVQFEVRGKNILGQTTLATTPGRTHYIVVFDDYNLGGVLDGVMRANRQRVDYVDGADDEWTAYQNAVSAGYALLNGNPDHSKMFVDASYTSCTENDYYDAVQAINAAVAALDAKAKPTDATLLAALDAELANYVNVDSDDYVLFTYDRFKDAYNRARGLSNSQVIPEGQEETYVKPAIPVFDLVYAKEQLELWGGRLIKKTAVKTHLNNAISYVNTELDSNDYTTESWATLTAKITAANTVVADTDALQTEVNDARIEILKAQRNLVEVAVTPTVYITANISGVTIDETNMRILGVTAQTLDILTYVTPAEGYEVSSNNTSPAFLGTGTLVTVTDANDNIVATYTVVVYGDVTGDGSLTFDDAGIAYAHLDNTAPIASGTKEFAALDTDANGTITYAEVDALYASIE